MKKSIKKALIILVIIFAVIIGAALLLSFLNAALDSDDNTYVTVSVESGDSTDDIANMLYDNDLIASVTKYKIISKIYRYDGDYKVGTYSVSPSMTCSEIATILISGVSVGNMVTIPEGYTIEQIAETLEEAGVADAETFLEVAANGDFSSFEFLDDAQSGENHLEGYLFPNTYSFSVDADEEMIIATMLNEFDIEFTDEMEERAEELGYTVNEIIIIASIIEKEAAVDEDRAKIASVIYNRLDDGMALQMCSTIQYILGYAKENLSTADTQIESPYNTYLYTGLPAGPICSPGLASIEAALYPEDTDYLYFVLSEKLDGSHNFSSTEDEFYEDVEAYSEAYAAAHADD